MTNKERKQVSYYHMI